jgi:NodT family efflux transporter outer membrane factor (OMF) lipoprotein
LVAPTVAGRVQSIVQACLSNALWLGAALAAFACNVGPDYVRPEAPMNARWSNTKDPRLAAGAEVDAAWWRAFDDPTLDRLVELAYRQNLPLQIAALRILEARAALGIAIGEQFPENPGPIAGASMSRLSEHQANGAGVDRSFGEHQIGFDAVWELDFWGKFRRGVRSARASYLATVADYDHALVSITAEVARTYVVIRTFEALIDQARRNVTLQEDGHRLAEARFTEGATSELDVAQAKSLLESTRASIPRLQVGLQQAHNGLSTLLGRPTGFVRSLLEQPRGIPSIRGRVAVSVPAEMLRRRPDVRSAELRAAAQCERIGMAQAELYPSFVLFGSIGLSTSTHGGDPSNDARFPDLFDPGSLVSSAGANMFWPILSYPRILNDVRVEDARFQQSVVAYVNTVILAAQEVEDGIAGFLLQQDAALLAEGAVLAAEAAVKLAMVQYREGAVDYQRVLDTQRVLLTLESELVDTRSAAATELIALYKALGGGWELRVGDPVVPAKTQQEMEERTNWGSVFSEPHRPVRRREAASPSHQR